ncbi:MAG: hypothetical protein Q8K79_03245 [Solirubrobacteraceae bacterium]|nr:hypothetical protein [Solirubrobacteraceae bacterium]
MSEPLTFGPSPGGLALRRGDEVLARIVSDGDDVATRLEIGESTWSLGIEGDREALAATWQAVARDAAGEESAVYYHGSMRGGRVKIGDRSGSLRRELGLGTEWKLRFKPDAGLTLRPTPRPEGMHLDLTYVPGSADVPELLLALVCWSIVTEEATGPARLGG